MSIHVPADLQETGGSKEKADELICGGNLLRVWSEVEAVARRLQAAI